MMLKVGKHEMSTTTVTAAAATGMAGVIEVAINNNPRAFEGVVENHFGNVPWSMAIALITEGTWLGLVRPRMVKSRPAEWLEKADTKVAFAALGLAALANVGWEVWEQISKGNNFEFGPDVVGGMAGALLVVGIMALKKLNKINYL